MKLSLAISPEVEAWLRSKSDAAGVDMQEYLQHYIETIAKRRYRVEDFSDPTMESELSENEIAEFLESEKHAMRAESRLEHAE